MWYSCAQLNQARPKTFFKLLVRLHLSTPSSVFNDTEQTKIIRQHYKYLAFNSLYSNYHSASLL